ncbi:hypothetical protein GQ43DRAFT_436050 [Delitschia confertaspora ATCC 74209]|uniref:Uncharacterized protein n=1 Tax=Delitschia confertaspora ATCC 74209 TaxID=1513339 RepID=A0A9P4JH35_9PLEO|nr:hypothetical protein GQ43DRAFT_436050 [Delitschia confertaspora ATCC 74209]
MKMNWTGGRLQRVSKNANKGDPHRQKQHFAKIRTQLQNGTPAHTVPFRPDFLQEGRLMQDGEFEKFASRSSHSRTLSKTLHRRQDGEKSHVRTERHINSEIAPHCLTKDSIEEPTLPSVPRTTASNQKLVRSTGQQASPPFGKPHDLPSPIKDPVPDKVNIGCFNTDPDSDPYSRKTAKKVKRKFAGTAWSTADDVLEERKRWLLKRPDWVGLAPSRPVKMHFPLRGDKDRIGKRRRVDRRERRVEQRHGGNKETMRPPSPFHYIRVKYAGLCMMSGALLNDAEDISVRIGTEALTQTNHTVDMRSQQARGGGRSLTQQSESSDPLLLGHLSKQLQPPHSESHIEAGVRDVVRKQPPHSITNQHISPHKSGAKPPNRSNQFFPCEVTPNLRMRDSGMASSREAIAGFQNQNPLPPPSPGSSFHPPQDAVDPSHAFRPISRDPSGCSACSTKGLHLHNALQCNHSTPLSKPRNSIPKSNEPPSSSAFESWKSSGGGGRDTGNLARDVIPGSSSKMVNEPLGRAEIIDDEDADAPWRAFLAIPGDDREASRSNSTSSCWHMPMKTGLTHPSRVLGTDRFDEPYGLNPVRRFSQQATVGMDTTQYSCTSSVLGMESTLSADGRLKPFADRGTNIHNKLSPERLLHRPGRYLGFEPKHKLEGKTVESEELWKQFVFGDGFFAWDLETAYRECMEVEENNDDGHYYHSSTPAQHVLPRVGKFPSSLAVAHGAASPASSTRLSITTPSKVASYSNYERISDDVQDARYRKRDVSPGVTSMRGNISRCFRSSASTLGIRSLSPFNGDGNDQKDNEGNEESDGLTTREKRHTGQDLVTTHASPNKLSSFTNSDVYAKQTDSPFATPSMFRKRQPLDGQQEEATTKRPSALEWFFKGTELPKPDPQFFTPSSPSQRSIAGDRQ